MSNNKFVVCTDRNGHNRHYSSVAECSRVFGCKEDHIRRVLRGERKTYKGNLIMYGYCGNTGKESECVKEESVKARNYRKRHPLRTVWSSMMERCGHWKSTHKRNLKYYRDNGIEVCSEWRRSFLLFEEWSLAHGWRRGLELDRIEGDKGYSPENCRFVTKEENMRNRRNNRWYEYNGTRFIQTDVERLFGIDESLFKYRINNGWSLSEAIETKPRVLKSMYVDIDGKKCRIRDAMKQVLCVVSEGAIRHRVNAGWDFVKAATTPLLRKHKT